MDTNVYQAESFARIVGMVDQVWVTIFLLFAQVWDAMCLCGSMALRFAYVPFTVGIVSCIFVVLFGCIGAIIAVQIHHVLYGTMTVGEILSTWWNTYMFKVRNRRRRMLVRMGTSRRAARLLRHLYEEDQEDFDTEVVGTPLAFRMSRLARAALHFPKYSPANERIVSDWIQRHWPENLRTTHKLAVLPLAIKLTFVADKFEIEANEIPSLFDLVPDCK